MSDRDRLAGLLANKDNLRFESYGEEADYLLKNGVIAPPCKVGDTVYVVCGFSMSEYTVNEISWDGVFFRCYCDNAEYAAECRAFMFFDERIGKTVFLTRELAEEALNEQKEL